MSTTNNQLQAPESRCCAAAGYAAPPRSEAATRLLVRLPLLLLLACGCVSVPGRLLGRPGISLYRVESVISGDAIIVKGVGKVKYIGVAAPQPSLTGKYDEKFWRESLEKNRELVEDRWVRLELDRKDSDTAGRILAYVFVWENRVSELFVNGEMIRLGLARLEESTVNTRYLTRLERLEQRAKRSRRGIWSE